MSDHLVNGTDDDALAREKSLEVLAAMTDQHSDQTWLKTVLLPTFAKFVSAQIKLATAPLIAHIAEQDQRIAALEARKHCGVHQRALAYKCGAQVTFDNAIWACIADAEPNESPGTSSKWQLVLRAPERRQQTTGVGR